MTHLLLCYMFDDNIEDLQEHRDFRRLF